MPRQKTKAQKKKSAERRHTSLARTSVLQPVSDGPVPIVEKYDPQVQLVSTSRSDAERLLGYPVQLLYRDLIKSSIITIALFAVLLGIYVYIGYNGVSLI